MPHLRRLTRAHRTARALGDLCLRVLCLGALASCALPSEPSDPRAVGAVQVSPPPAYARWWAEMESCLGRPGLFAGVTWWRVPGSTIPLGDGRRLAGLFRRQSREIQIAEAWWGHSAVVKHEIAHAILGDTHHDHWVFAPFNRCGITSVPVDGWDPPLDPLPFGLSQ